MVVEIGSMMATSTVQHLLNVVIFGILTGYQLAILMVTSSVQHLLNVVISSIFTGYQLAINVFIFNIFNIVSRDVPCYDQPRCFVSKALHATSSSHSASYPDPPRARSKMDGTHICLARKLMRWLTALLCFVEEQYYTLERGNYTRHTCIFRYIPAATTPDTPAQELPAATNCRIASARGFPHGVTISIGSKSNDQVYLDHLLSESSEQEPEPTQKQAPEPELRATASAYSRATYSPLQHVAVQPKATQLETLKHTEACPSVRGDIKSLNISMGPDVHT
jgi:hypothetical protein